MFTTKKKKVGRARAGSLCVCVFMSVSEWLSVCVKFINVDENLRLCLCFERLVIDVLRDLWHECKEYEIKSMNKLFEEFFMHFSHIEIIDYFEWTYFCTSLDYTRCSYNQKIRISTTELWGFLITFLKLWSKIIIY